MDKVDVFLKDIKKVTEKHGLTLYPWCSGDLFVTPIDDNNKWIAEIDTDEWKVIEEEDYE